MKIILSAKTLRINSSGFREEGAAELTLEGGPQVLSKATVFLHTNGNDLVLQVSKDDLIRALEAL